MPTGSDHSSVQATVRQGTDQRPSAPACAAAGHRQREQGEQVPGAVCALANRKTATRPHRATDRVAQTLRTLVQTARTGHR